MCKVCRVSVFLFFLVLIQHADCSRVFFGIDALVSNDFAPLRGKKVGLITHTAAVDSFGVPTADHFRKSNNIRLVAFFSPEHGIDGTVPAGQYVPSRRDNATGLPIYSLYGPTRKPTKQMLQGIDILVYDMQDIGARSYTYISTMGLAMQAASENGVQFMVLDRPNPLGGNRVEGPPLDPRFRSFVGQFDIPYVHGLTVGELAFFLNETSWMARHPLHLHIVKMQGWRRSMLWQDTGLRWVPTSPNIPLPRSALDFVTTGWLGELGTVHNGIFTDSPFRLVGTRTLDANAFAAAMNQKKITGIRLNPTSYKITQGRFAGDNYAGAGIEYSDLSRANLSEFSPLVLLTLREMTGRDFISTAPAAKIEMFDKVVGGSTLRDVLVNRQDTLRELFAEWDREAQKFRRVRNRFLLYP